MKTPAKTLRFSTLALATALLAPAGLFANDADDRIEKSFKDSYTYRTQLKSSDISADSENGVVTLKGKVDTTDHKALAEDTVRGLPGVVSVNNELKVKSEPKESSDEWIALKVRSSLLYHRNVSLMDSDVAVVNGNVTLTGTAESAAEKSLAGEYAADVKGVKNVDNRITIISDAEKKMAKAERKADKERAEWNADRAEDRAERNADHARAEARAEKDRVDAKIDAKEREARRDVADNRRDMGDKIDDASITAQVKGSLAVSRSASAIRTEVTTREGVVTLRGEAKSAAEKELAGRIAKDIRGVRDVNNEIVVVNRVAGE